MNPTTDPSVGIPIVVVPPARTSTEKPPRTELGRKLREIRERIVASGVPLLDLQGLEQELAARRGESEGED